MYSLIERLSRELSSQVTLAANAANGTASAIPQSIVGVPLAEFATLWRFISSFAIAGDWVKLFFLGTVLETIRRFASQMWASLLDSFFLTATFESDDDAYNWMMIWIARQPGVWSKARDVQVSTKVGSLYRCTMAAYSQNALGMGYQH
jgi:chaperone BCS1